MYLYLKNNLALYLFLYLKEETSTYLYLKSKYPCLSVSENKIYRSASVNVSKPKLD